MRFTPTVSEATEAAGINAAAEPNSSPCRFSFTITPQSAAGGCTPSPRKLSALIKRIAKVKRIPNSAARGASVLGRISRTVIHHKLSPRERATSTKSITEISIAKARDNRNTRVESIIATVAIMIIKEVPSADITISARMIEGNAINASLIRLINPSIQRPLIAAINPRITPREKDNRVTSSARPIVIRAPYKRRENTSRPR